MKLYKVKSNNYAMDTFEVDKMNPQERYNEVNTLDKELYRHHV